MRGGLRRRARTKPPTAPPATTTPATAASTTQAGPPSEAPGSSGPSLRTGVEVPAAGLAAPGSCTSSVGGVPVGRVSAVGVDTVPAPGVDGAASGVVGVEVDRGTTGPAPVLRSSCWGPAVHSPCCTAGRPPIVNETAVPSRPQPGRWLSWTTCTTYAVALPWRMAGRSPGAACVQSTPSMSARTSVPSGAAWPSTVTEP